MPYYNGRYVDFDSEPVVPQEREHLGQKYYLVYCGFNGVRAGKWHEYLTLAEAERFCKRHNRRYASRQID